MRSQKISTAPEMNSRARTIFSEHGFVNSSEKSKAEPCSSQQERQTDHE
jgi:hypothetical protein